MISGKQVPPFCGLALISTHYNTSVHECIVSSFSPWESNAVRKKWTFSFSVCIELDGSDLQLALKKARSRGTLWVAFIKPLHWHFATLFWVIHCNSRHNPSYYSCHPVWFSQIGSCASLASVCVRKEPGARLQISIYLKRRGAGYGAQPLL